MVSQGCLVTLTVFAGGLFRPFDEASKRGELMMVIDYDAPYHLVVRFFCVSMASELGRSTSSDYFWCLHTHEDEFALI